MTAQTVSVPSSSHVTRSARESMFLGFGSVLRKELAEWGRGRGPLVIAGLSIAAAVFTTVIPFIAPPTPGVPELSRDATTNVLLGWAGLTVALVAILSTMSTSRLMLTSSSLPMFSGSATSLSASRMVPSVQSSMYMNERVCSPSPQISISWRPDSLAAITLRQIAAGAFSRPPS